MTKVVIIDRDERICASVIKHTGAEHRRLANRAMEEALEQAGLSFDEVSYVIATGYGRIVVPFADRQITELTCHARGVFSSFPNVRLAIDIGGQDAKGLKINNGRLLDFTMSDKCAAGTGRYLDLLAEALGLKIDDLGSISLKSTNKVTISSTCTVFAQQEVVSRLSEGIPLEDIVAGIHDAIASRVARMVERLNLGCEVLVPEEPLLSGAIGAALLGKEITLKALAQGETIQRGERRLDKATFFE